MKDHTKRNNFYSGENLCVCCGNEIPEGRLVCFTCERLGKTQPSEKNAGKNTVKSINPDEF